MQLNEYQLAAMQFAVFKNSDYPFYALAEEVGEFLGMVAKERRGDDLVARYGSAEKLGELVIKELGDILWQLAACCHVVGVDLETVAKMNIDKLADRAARDVIKGEGDER